MTNSQSLSPHDALDRGGKAQPLLRVRGLQKHFTISRGGMGRQAKRVHAVDGVDFEVYKGETLGIVGESGCGKSTTARLLMHLLDADHGEMVFDGDPIGQRGGISVREMRRQVQMVFQNSYASLNPRMSVEDSIAFGPQVHGVNRRESRQRARRLLDQVGLSPSLFAHRYPHELSGGQRQRVNIARALALEPRLLILDEAVSALDKSVEAQVLNLLMDLKQEYGLTYLFISHDLNVVRYISDRVMVMYLGKVAEMGEVEALYRAPAHPYTRALLSAMPSMNPNQRTQQAPLVGDPPNPIDLPPGCRFCPRCPMVEDACRAAEPPLEACGTAHQVACRRADEVMAGAVPVKRVSEESPT
ncbi:ATP-binding cassette domain-containing protein [Halomonas sp. ML-15]|uniref:ABC transporter ATP-binding protein n=1 Tax=Halomonas sp. ML-15 TaxID=2773305 RepID=UPI001746AACB|nr:oligopeptide/dipeptide ABC transporter ATP-binding protein [Halomonas sp. ML-15]MBD3897114.1 ATP-binding cassette domain-containing protein [Halomonas sp. ML-15]